MNVKVYEVPESAKDEPCALCDEPGCDLWVQEFKPGGLMIIVHKTCFDAFSKASDRTDAEADEVVA